MPTSELSVPTGIWGEDGIFRFPIRTYYEDTDLGGMVYHARYVSFFERVRTESLRGSPLEVDTLLQTAPDDGGPLVYVVRRIEVTYHRQAKEADLLIGHVRLSRVRAAAVECLQWLERDGVPIADAKLTIALIGMDGRPRRWPKAAKIQWQTWLDTYNAACPAGD